MFSLFKSQTKLEELCVGLSPEQLLRPLSDTNEDNPKAVAIAMLLLSQSGNLLTGMHNDQQLKKYCKKVNPNLVILETIIYLHAMLSYFAMDSIYDENEILDTLNTALGGALATVKNLSTITGAEKLSISRGYVPNIQTSTERFALILEHSCFGTEPVLKPGIDLHQAKIETYVSIRAHTAAFAQAQISACSETIEKIMEGV